MQSRPLPVDDLVDAKPMTGGEIRIENVSIVFGEGENSFVAVDRVSTDIAGGEFICILGPSGCGRSTLLNAVAGLEATSGGRISVDGTVVTGTSAERGMVFQQPALFPWKTVRKNVAYGPRMSGHSDAKANRIADRLLEMVGLAAFTDKRPQTLSGGMQQRTAIARALAEYAAHPAHGRALWRARRPDTRHDAGEPPPDLA